MFNLIVLLLCLLGSTCSAATTSQPSNTFLFSGRLNLKNSPQSLDPSDFTAMQNFICDDESCYTRNGNVRFNTTAPSTMPFTSLYKAYSQTGKSIFIGTSFGKIYVSTQQAFTREGVYYTSGASVGQDVWVATYSIGNLVHVNNLANTITYSGPHNNKFQFITYNNMIYMTDGATVPLRYNIEAGSMSFTGGSPPKAKFIFLSGEYVLMARTTDFQNRLFYSNVGNAESWPIANSFDVGGAGSGNPITGISNDQSGFKVYLENSVWQVKYSKLSPNSDGDQVASQLFDGFGNIAPYALCSIAGQADFILARDGFRLVVGGDSLIVSRDIQPVVNRLIKSGKGPSTVAFYDNKNKWIWVSFEDDLGYPRGANNMTYIYDIILKKWYPITGVNAASFCSWEAGGDKGERFYGDSNDGYVYQMDIDGLDSDPRKELPFALFESITSGSPLDLDCTNYIQGNAALQIATSQGGVPAMTSLNSISTYPDGTGVSESDLIQFKVFRDKSSTARGVAFRIAFAGYGGNSTWEWQLSPSVFPTSGTWLTLSTPIASATNISGSGVCSEIKNCFKLPVDSLQSVPAGHGGAGSYNFLLDDMRIVQSSRAIINATIDTKPLFSETVRAKNFNYVYVDCEVTPHTNFPVYFLNDYGRFTVQQNISGGYENAVFVTTGNSIVKLSKSDFSVISTSNTFGNNIDLLHVQEDFIFGLSKSSGIIYKMDADSLTLIAQSSGFSVSNVTLSSAVSFTGFQDKLDILETQRVVRIDQNLVFVDSFPLLGITSATAITRDNNSIYVFDSVGRKIVRFNESYSEIQSIATNNISSGAIFVTDKNLICVFNANSFLSRISGGGSVVSASSFTAIQLRDKLSLSLLKESQQMDGGTGGDQFGVTSDGKTIFVISSTSINGIQAYNTEDLSFIRQNISIGNFRGVSSNEYFAPSKVFKLPIGMLGRSLKVRYAQDKRDDRIRLKSQTFVLSEQELR